LHYIIEGVGSIDLTPLQRNIGRSVPSATSFVTMTGQDTTDLTGLKAGTGIVQLNTAVSRFLRIDPFATGGSPTLSLYLAGQ